MVRWTWWDWSLSSGLLLPSVLWRCWLGHLTRKNPSVIWPIMWDVKPYSINQSTLSAWPVSNSSTKSIWLVIFKGEMLCFTSSPGEVISEVAECYVAVTLASVMRSEDVVLIMTWDLHLWVNVTAEIKHPTVTEYVASGKTEQLVIALKICRLTATIVTAKSHKFHKSSLLSVTFWCTMQTS